MTLSKSEAARRKRKIRIHKENWCKNGGKITWSARKWLGKGISRKISQDDVDTLFFAAADIHELSVRLAQNGCEREAMQAHKAAGSAVTTLQMLGFLPPKRAIAQRKVLEFCCAREGTSTEVSPQGDAALSTPEPTHVIPADTPAEPVSRGEEPV